MLWDSSQCRGKSKPSSGLFTSARLSERLTLKGGADHVPAWRTHWRCRQGKSGAGAQTRSWTPACMEAIEIGCKRACGRAGGGNRTDLRVKSNGTAHIPGPDTRPDRKKEIRPQGHDADRV